MLLGLHLFVGTLELPKFRRLLLLLLSLSLSLLLLLLLGVADEGRSIGFAFFIVHDQFVKGLSRVYQVVKP